MHVGDLSGLAVRRLGCGGGVRLPSLGGGGGGAVRLSDSAHCLHGDGGVCGSIYSGEILPEQPLSDCHFYYSLQIKSKL